MLYKEKIFNFFDILKIYIRVYYKNMTTTLILTNTNNSPNYDYIFELTGPSNYVLNTAGVIPDGIEITLQIKDKNGNNLDNYNLNTMGAILFFQQGSNEKTLEDIASGNIVSGDITNINFENIVIEPTYGGNFFNLGNFFLADTNFEVQITFSDIPVRKPLTPVTTGSIIFDMERKLYSDLEALNQTNPAEVSSIVQNALLSVFNISNVTIQSLLFNSIDVSFTSSGNDFDASNFEIYENDKENIVNAFVDAANNASLSTGPYTANDLTLNAVDSRGEYTDQNGVVTAYTCFAAGSMVETNQGSIAIERLNSNRNTINGKKWKPFNGNDDEQCSTTIQS